MGTQWRQSELVAWTDRDGPERAPRGAPRWLWAATGAAIATSTTVVLATDSLCPEHRTWVQVIGSLAIVGALVSLVSLARGWSSTPLFTMASASLGVCIGLIDLVHEPVRGMAVTSGYVGALVLSWWIARRELATARWARRLADGASSRVDDAVSIGARPVRGDAGGTVEPDEGPLPTEPRVTADD